MLLLCLGIGRCVVLCLFVVLNKYSLIVLVCLEKMVKLMLFLM